MSECAVYQELTDERPLEFRKKLRRSRFYVSGECYSRGMKNLTRKEAQTCKLTFLLLFFPVLLFCTGAYPAKQKVVKDLAENIGRRAYKRGLGVTLRTGVNGGFNTQQKIKDHDKALAAVLEKVYGSVQLQHSPGCAY